MAISQSPLPTPLEPQQVDLGAKERLAAGEMIQEGLDDLSQAAISEAKNMSQQNLAKQTATFQQTLQQAKESMLTNPSPQNIEAQKNIVNNAVQVSKQVPLMAQEKSTLEKSLNVLQNDFNDRATTLAVQNQRRSSAIDYENNFEPVLNTVSQLAIQGNTKLADKTASSFLETTKNLVENGSLPIDTYQKAHVAIQNLQIRNAFLIKNQNNIAQDPQQKTIQKNIGFGFPQDNPGMNSTSSFLTSSVLDSNDMQSAKANILNGGNPNLYTQNPKVSLVHASWMYNYALGVNTAASTVQTGMSYPKLEAQAKQLNSSHAVITPSQEGMRDKYNKILSDIKNNYFQFYVANTNAGQQALENKNNQLSVIKQKLATRHLTAQEAAQQQNETESNFYNQVVSYANAHKIPAQYIKPVDPNSQIAKDVTSMFDPGADVASGLNSLKKFPVITPYLASMLPAGRQQEIAHLAGMSDDNAFANLIVKANQTGINLPKPTQDVGTFETDIQPVSNSSILTALRSNKNVGNYLNFVNSTPNGILRQNDIEEGFSRAVKYCLATPNNTLDNCVSTISKGLPSSDQYLSGVTQYAPYKFLNSQFQVPLSDADARMIANEVSDSAYKTIKQSVQSYQEELDKKNNYSPSQREKIQREVQLDSKLLAQKTVNPLHITNGPDGYILAYDAQTGTIITKTQMSPKLLSQAHQNKINESLIKLESRPISPVTGTRQAGIL